jgi:hypothetical protein
MSFVGTYEIVMVPCFCCSRGVHSGPPGPRVWKQRVQLYRVVGHRNSALTITEKIDGTNETSKASFRRKLVPPLRLTNGFCSSAALAVIGTLDVVSTVCSLQLVCQCKR